MLCVIAHMMYVNAISSKLSCTHLYSVSPSHFYYGAAPCPFSPAPCPFSQRHALFSESTFYALNFGKKFLKIGQKIRKLQDFLLEVCRNKFGKIFYHNSYSC